MRRLPGVLLAGQGFTVAAQGSLEGRRDVPGFWWECTFVFLPAFFSSEAVQTTIGAFTGPASKAWICCFANVPFFYCLACTDTLVTLKNGPAATQKQQQLAQLSDIVGIQDAIWAVLQSSALGDGQALVTSRELIREVSGCCLPPSSSPSAPLAPSSSPSAPLL